MILLCFHEGMRPRIFVLVAFLALVSLVLAGETMATDAEADTKRSSYDHLSMLEDSDLRQIIHEKTRGRVHLEQFKTRLSLLKAVQQLEEEERKQKALNTRVKAALNKTPITESYEVSFLFCTG